jgi:hypothetical protein
MANVDQEHAPTARGSDQLVVRPSRGLRLSGGTSVGAAAWILASALYALRFHGSSRLIVISVGIAIVVSVIGAMSLSRRRTKLMLNCGQLVFSSILRDHLLLAADGRGRVVNVEVYWGTASSRRSRLWLLINATGRTMVGLNRDTWDERQLESLRERLELPLKVESTPMRPAELRKSYPGSVAWWAVHPGIAALLAIIVVVALVLGLQPFVS